MMQDDTAALLLCHEPAEGFGAWGATVPRAYLPCLGHYRLVDLALSSLMHAGVDSVGMLVQYCPHALLTYVGNGAVWKMAGGGRGIQFLPPCQTDAGAVWYHGALDALRQNLHFLEQTAPAHVFVLWGDRLCQIDLCAMLAQHRRTHAACTVAAVRHVGGQGTGGTALLSGEGERLLRVGAAPAPGAWETAGAFLFRADVLYRLLCEYRSRPLPPAGSLAHLLLPLLFQGACVSVYRHRGYFRRIATAEDFFTAHMDLLAGACPFPPPGLPLRGNDMSHAPHWIGAGASVRQSWLAAGCTVEGEVEQAVLFPGATVEAGAQVAQSVLLPGACIRAGVRIGGCLVGEGISVTATAVYPRALHGGPVGLLWATAPDAAIPLQGGAAS